MSTAEERANKATYERLQAAGNSGDLELISKTLDEVVDPDVLIHMQLPVEATGTQALKQLEAMLLRAFPDLRVTVEDVIAAGDKVVGRHTVTGTHLGEYMGRPPTGKSVRYSEIFIMRFAEGRVVEMWGVVDVLSQLRQLGMIPELG